MSANQQNDIENKALVAQADENKAAKPAKPAKAADGTVKVVLAHPVRPALVGQDGKDELRPGKSLTVDKATADRLVNAGYARRA